MRKIIAIAIIFIISAFFSTIILRADTVFLKKISVEGNRITKTSYIMSKVNLKTGRTYNVDDLMEKMSEIKSKLLKTGLFEELYFDDQLDNNGNLNLIIKVKERNYLFFGPEGSLYIKNNIYPDISVYLEYINLLGMNHDIKVSLPIYENRGIFINFMSDNQKKFIIDSSIDVKKVKSDPIITKDYLTANIYFLYNLAQSYYLGSGILYNRYYGSSFIFYPLIKLGSTARPEEKSNWYYSENSLKIGYGEDDKLIYGLSTELYYFRSLLLQIIFKTGISFDYLGGDVPKNLLLSNTARGYPSNYITGDKRISPKAELFVPLQWFPKLAISLFVDSDIIGYNNLKLIVGGGIGIRWFNKYQNPLIVDFAFGKGFEINLSKKI